MSDPGRVKGRTAGRLGGGAARYALAASALLLCAPDERVRAQLQASGRASGCSLAALRQSFYDRFCIPQSGLYIPPYEHVFQRRKRIGGCWHFPPARFDGASAVEAIYGRFGFRHRELDAEPILRAPHLPGDHLGFMLAFVGWVLEGVERRAATPIEVVAHLQGFITNHLDEWVEAYGDLLQRSEPDGYSAAVGEAVCEAMEEARKAVAESTQGRCAARLPAS